MKFLLPLRHGLGGARRHFKLVFLVYLLSLLPALLVAYLAFRDLLPELGRSLFAGRALEGDRMGVWNDYLRSADSTFDLVTGAAVAIAVIALILHILTAAGVVEALLSRERRREHPFLLGVGRHGWRFTRSALWFAVALVPLGALLAAAFGGVNEIASSQADGRIHLFGWPIALGLGLLVYMFLDLGYDLSRIAAATHDAGGTFLGFFRGLFHALRHPLILAPFWLLLTLLVVGLHLAYVAGRAAVQPGNLLEVILVVLVQQVVFLAAAYLRVSLWAGEIAYYQAMGEPPWCRTRRQRRREREAAEEARQRQEALRHHEELRDEERRQAAASSEAEAAGYLR